MKKSNSNANIHIGFIRTNCAMAVNLLIYMKYGIINMACYSIQNKAFPPLWRKVAFCLLSFVY